MKVIRFFVIFLLLSCSEDRLIGPYGSDGSVPGKISNVKIERTAGGAELSYNLPADENFLYVKAVYSIRPGVVREEKASFNTNILAIKGFPDTSEYEVELYSVSKSEVVSEPVRISFKPLLPPVVEAFNSLAINSAFGGVRVSYENSSASDLVLTILSPDSIGDMAVVDVSYTKAKQGNFFSRGFESEPRKFGVYFKDRWNNYSDTVYTELTPLFEKELDKDLFRPLPLPTDNWKAFELVAHMVMENLWDGKFGANNSYNVGLAPLPQAFAFSIGEESKLSRFHIYPNLVHQWYAFPREFEIWGSNNPDPSGNWDHWEKLGAFEIIKPSGLPAGAGNTTAEDLQQLVDGFGFEFPEEAPAVKYLRFRTLSFYGGVNFEIQEMDFFGSPVVE